VRIPFVKGHGLGNDFVVVDAAALGDVNPRGAVGRAICDRFRGVGADGVLVCSGTPDDPEMIVVNADGSVAEMCGNGLRVFVKWVVERHGAKDALVVRTGGGPKRCSATRGADGRVDRVAVEMGRPSFDAARVPVVADGELFEAPFQIDGESLTLSAVNMGNPHAVLIGAFDEASRRRLGPAISSDPRFPAQANVEFARVVSRRELVVDVFERGCGFTQACGTGACAATAVCVRAGEVDAGAPVCVRLPGGDLTITVAAGLGSVWMEGPARFVYEGALDWPLAV